MESKRAPSHAQRVILYGRKSKKDGDERSVDDQLGELRRWAAREGRAVVAELRDDGVSASRFARGAERAGWQEALNVLATEQADELAVWEVSRSTRDRAVWAALVAGLIDAGAALVVGGKVHDPADADDGFALDLGAALAVRESAMTSKRVLRAVESRAAAGEPHGALPFGYRITYDASTGRPLRRVPDPETAPIIREAAARLLAGETATSVARDLNARGVPGKRGGRWTSSRVVSVIGQPALAGLRVHRGVVQPDVSGSWEPILDRATHDRLVALFADPSRRNRRNGSQVRLLTGVATCGECGGPIGTSTLQRANGRRVVYRCRLRVCVTTRCCDDVDELVNSAVVEFLSRPNVIGELAADDPSARAAADRVAELRAELARARDMHRARRLSLDSLVSMEEWAIPEIDKLERRARPRHVPSRVFDIADAPNVAMAWKVLPIPQRRAIVGALLAVSLHKRAAPGRVFDPSTVRVTRR